MLKRENRLLCAILVLQFALLIYSDYRNDQVKAHVTPQSVTAACNKAIGAK